MKYNEKEFNSAIESYKLLIGNVKGKSFLIIFDISNKDAFFSLAPLSRAFHELGADVACNGIKGKSDSIEAAKDVWKTSEELENGTKNEKTDALKKFIEEVDKKAKGEFRKIRS